MNKSEAIKRLDAIEKERAELRKIIEKGYKIVYEQGNIYIMLHYTGPHLLVGNGAETKWRYHHLNDGHKSCLGLGEYESAQEAIDFATQCNYPIHAFGDTKKALQFFIDHL